MKPLELHRGTRYEIHDQARYVRTTFADGWHVRGVPSYDDESVARARALGYDGPDDEAVWAMTRDHDLLHSLVSHAIDEQDSHALRWSQRGVQEPGRIPLEERLVFLVQRALNARSAVDLV